MRTYSQQKAGLTRAIRRVERARKASDNATVRRAYHVARWQDGDDPAIVAALTALVAEWQAKIRTDSQYGFDKTSTARQGAAQLATQLAQSFGAI